METLQGFSTSYLVAMVMGFFTSLHCLGMCGSIIGALTLSLRQDIRRNTQTIVPCVEQQPGPHLQLKPGFFCATGFRSSSCLKKIR
jgi:sulfite exporter TauE/SafE